MRKFLKRGALTLLILGGLWVGLTYWANGVKAQSAGCPNPNPNLSAWATLTGPFFQGLDTAPSVNCPLPAGTATTGLNGALNTLATAIISINTSITSINNSITSLNNQFAALPTTYSGRVATNAALLATNSTAYSRVYRGGFLTDGDGGGMWYVSSTSACSLNSGNGDSGSQVKSADGKCWLADFQGQPVNPLVFGAKGDGINDDAPAIKSALLTCNAVMFTAGKTYGIGSPLPICSGGQQKILGHGRASAIKLLSTYSISQVTPCSATSDGAQWRAIFFNPNCGGAPQSFTDTHIEYNDLYIDGTAVPAALTSTIAIFNRGVRYLYEHRIVCNGFADCTATLGSKDTLIEDSISLSTGNAGFDHWDSPLDATVINSTVFCNSGTVFGILFNSADTTSTHDGIGANFHAINNTEVGCNNSLGVDPLTAGGTIKGVHIIGNLANGANTASTNGINITGAVSGVEIVAPIARDIPNGSGLFLGVTNTHGPDHVVVTAPQFINISAAAGVNAPLRLLSGSGSTNRVTGASYSGGGSFLYAIDTNETGAYIEGQFPIGSTGVANLAGSFPKIVNFNNTSVGVTACGSAPAPTIGGSSTLWSVTPGGGGGTSCTVTFPANYWSSTPTCSVSSTVTATGALGVNASTSQVVITSVGNQTGSILQGQCAQ